MHKDAFIQALNSRAYEAVEKIPKSDLHSHAGRGGALSYIEEWARVRIDPPAVPCNSLDDMNRWLNKNVKCHFPDGQGYLKNAESYKTHPIRKLFDYAVPVTINLDDLLIFNASVSQEYLNLFKVGLMNDEELNLIRETGLRHHYE